MKKLKAKKQIEQELDTKHYFHQRLLETLDLGLLSSLDKDKAKKVVKMILEDLGDRIG